MKTKQSALAKPAWKALVILVLLALVVAALLLGSAIAAPDISYALDWWTLDAGGGISTGGSYNLSGGIAQPDAGSMSGGSYQLQGGFWQGTTYLIHLPLVIQ